MARDKKFARRLLAAVGAMALLVSACGPAGDPPDEPPTDETPADNGQAAPDEDLRGLAMCDERPLDCNSGERAEGGQITWMINQGHDGVFNHHRPEGGSVYLMQMLEGIMPSIGDFDPAGEWQWNMDLLAEEPEIINEDPQTMRYVLRDEAQWDDGTPIGIDDFKWVWYHNSGRDDHCDGCDPRATTGFENVASMEAEDDAGKVIVITYEDGFVDPEWFARFGPSYPAHVPGVDWENDPAAMGETSQFFLTNTPDWSGGPYVVESWIPDERVVMTPNPNWYGETQPTLETLVKEIIPDQGSWVPAMQNREIDGGSPASFEVDLVEQLEQIPGTYVGLGSGGAVWEHVDFNMNTVSDPALRQAIFTAIDIEDARTRIFGDLEPPLRTNHIFDAASPYHQDFLTDTGYGTGDIEAATAILTDAGYTGIGEELTDPDGNPVPALRFTWLDGNENRATFAQLTQSYLADLGITLDLEATPGDQLGTVLAAADFDLVIFGWSGSPLFTTGPQQFWDSESASNFGRMSNPQIDEIVRQVPNQLDLDDSAELANQAVELVMEEAYSLPLWDTLNMMFVSDEYVNIRDNHYSDASLRSLYNVAEWGVAAN